MDENVECQKVGENFSNHYFWYGDDSDDDDMFEFYQYVESERGRLEIEKYRQREKWLKFEYPEDYSGEYDPADGDLRGDYKEIDKNRKKTWHRGKGANPNYKHNHCKSERLYRIARKRQCRHHNKKFTFDVVKAPQLVDKFHHGTKVYDSGYYYD